MNIRLFKKIDTVIGFLVARMVPRQRHGVFIYSISSLLIIRPGGIGDAVLLAPIISLLKKNDPTIHISILSEKRNAGVISLIYGVDTNLCYDRPTELFEAFQSSYDCVIDSEQSHFLSAVVARIIRAPLKIGFYTNERRRMFSHTIPYLQDDYEATSFTNLLAPLCIDSASMKENEPYLSIPSSAKKKADILLASLQGKTFITLFPGASIQERRWGKERFQKVAELLSIIGVAVVVV